jgi:hypothetical protein
MLAKRGRRQLQSGTRSGARFSGGRPACRLADASSGHPEFPFTAAEHAYGRPLQALDVNQGEFRMIQWPYSQDIAEE